MVKIGASILGGDFSNLGEEIRKLEKAEIDFVSFDVMDGHFVNNITMGPDIIKSLRSVTKLPFEAHLMIENADTYCQTFVDAGCDIIIAHIESKSDMKNFIEIARKNKKRVGIALNPDTDAERINKYLDKIDLVLVMTVNPGFAGQGFMDESDKIKYLRSYRDEKGLGFEIEVDGGINDKSSAIVRKSGADILVSASYIFKSRDYGEAVRKLKG